MQTIQDRAALRAALDPLRQAGETIALVPTMGALHDGHMALVADARRRADHVVVSIFVNPKQFGPNEDYAAYPRPAAADAAKLTAAGVAFLWMPPVAEMYPEGFATTISVAGQPLSSVVKKYQPFFSRISKKFMRAPGQRSWMCFRNSRVRAS